MIKMPTVEPRDDRWQLGFVEAALSAFSFLTAQGFLVTSTEPTLVRYESPTTFVNVLHGRSSYELGAEIGRWIFLGDERVEQTFPLTDIITLTRNAEEVGVRQITATDSKTVGKFLPLLAEWTRAYAMRAIEGDNAFFSELSARALERSKGLEAGWDAEELRAEANAAWRNRDYAGVRRAYEALEELPSVLLSETELRRLEYARKHEL